ncbi:MAG: 16S rRNA (cytidine(1402)-2'-O)-methyltransferase [Burkholderiales bacterium]
MSSDTATLPTLLRQAAAHAAGGQQYPPGTLYVVATPIGNLADLSLRAIHVLGLVDAVACEDTRVSGGLLHRIGLQAQLLAVHQHNEQRAAAEIVARLSQGERIAYVSDAGTPAVSDPGARLVAAVHAAGLRVVPVPGPSSVAAALSVAGDGAAAAQGGAFAFVGFAPAKGRERKQAVDDLVARFETTVLFEAPHRMADLATALAERCPARTLTLCRELSKQFEQIDVMACRDLPAWLAADAQRLKGEFALVLHAVEPVQATAALAPATERMLQALLASLPLKQAVALCADATGAARNVLYDQALAWKAAQDAAAVDDSGEGLAD